MLLRLKLSLLVSMIMLTGCINQNGNIIADGIAENITQDVLPEPKDRFAAAQARLKLGFVYLSEGELELAYLNMVKAVQYAPEDYQTQLGMALYEQAIGDYFAAENRYELVRALAPQNGAVLNNYGAFLCHLRQYDKAQQQFKTVIDSGDNPYLANSLENAGYCYIQEGKVEKAEPLLRRAISRAPDKGDYLLITANEYFERKDYVVAKALNNVYLQVLRDSAASLWLQLRIAALEDRPKDVKRYSGLLAKNHSQSKEYQQYLANEY